MSERKSNIMVTVIDGEALGKQVREQMKDLAPEVKFTLYQGMGFVKTQKGTYILDTDGMGPADPIEKESAEVGIKRADIMACMPYTYIQINKKNLAGVPVCGKINLSAFVRVHGQRLESNFKAWDTFLTAAQPLLENLEISQVPA